MRRVVSALLALVAVVATQATAPAAVDLSTGIRYVIPAGTLDECGTKAQAALSAFLKQPVQTGTNSHEYIATGPVGGFGDNAGTTAGTVHCFPLGKGYAVTFTCAVETPNSPYDASALCLDIAHNFSGKEQKPLPVPTPLTAPKGCTTQSLAGEWVVDKDRSQTFKMEPDGSLSGPDGVSGSWYLAGTTAQITYYGNNPHTLSADGKHLSGKYGMTRKC